MKNNAGFTFVEAIVVAILMAVLAAVAIPAYSNYVANAKIDTARSNCELLAAAIAHQHARGLAIPEEASLDYLADLGITDPKDETWDYTVEALAGDAIMSDTYALTAEPIDAGSSLGTWKLKPKKSGTDRWVKQ